MPLLDHRALLMALLMMCPTTLLAQAAEVPATTAADDATTKSVDEPDAVPSGVKEPAQDVEAWITKYSGSLFYPSQHGLPGYPGYEKDHPIYGRKWGYAERIPYPGSVEHYRIEQQRYIPVVPQFNAKTLLKNFRATELPNIAADRVVEYSEPVYYVPKYPITEKETKKIIDAYDTGLKNAPVKVVKWGPGDAPIELNLGSLGPSVYVVRVIAATQTQNVEQATKRLVIHFDVNDGADGTITSYQKRCAAIDEFYSIVEFYFHAPEKREYKVKLWVDESSKLPLLVYNLDAHDYGAQLARQAAKKSASLYDPIARAEVWKSKGIVQPKKPITPQEQLDRDKKIWEQMPKDNAQVITSIGMVTWGYYVLTTPIPAGKTDDGLGVDLYGDETLMNYKPPADWETKLTGNDKYNVWVKVTAADLMNRYKVTRQTGYPVANKLCLAERQQFTNATLLAKKYHDTGDPVAGRDAVVYLATLAWKLPVEDSRQSLMTYDLIPQVDWGKGDMAFRRREHVMFYDLRDYWFGADGNTFIESYDYLYPLIKDNQELADSLARFIPWIKTPDDVIKFLDTYILQFYAHEVMTYGAYLSDPTPLMMAKVAAIQQDPKITKPWIDWDFAYVWTYPNRPMGVDELAVNNIQRDGTHKIGSRSYAGGGNFLTDLSTVFSVYYSFGGTLPVDLTDRSKFPKATEMTFFPMLDRVAGYNYQIGDVGGPSELRYANFGRSESYLFRLGWKRTHDPRFASVLANHMSREQESDAEWAAIIKAAQGQRSPYLASKSRVLSDWFGLLESGSESDDFRFHRAVGMRVGLGYGHAHDDALDLQIFSQGVMMCGDGAQRPGYSQPDCVSKISHNLVVTKLAATGNHNWISSFADTEGSRYMEGRVSVGGVYNRQIAQIDARPGTPSKEPLPYDGPKAVLPKGVVPADSYVVDVSRVNGGDVPAFAFHGPPADQFEANISQRQPGADSPEPYLKSFIYPERKWTGKSPKDDELVATWRLRRDTERVVWDNKPLDMPAAEQRMLGVNFDASAPRKFIRLHLLGHEDAPTFGARTICHEGNTFTFENFYLRPGDWKGQASFPVVYEPYSGDPYIQSVRLISTANASQNAAAPIAIQIKFIDDRIDVVYMAPRDSKATEIPGVGTVQGEYALISRDAKGIRQLTLSGGTKLTTKDGTIECKQPAHVGKIQSIDFAKHTLVLSASLPDAANGEVIELGPDSRRTAYTLAKVQGNQVTLDKGMDLAASRVTAIDEDGTLTVKSYVFPVGASVCDDSGKHIWRVAPYAKVRALQLTGGPSVKENLHEGDMLWVLETGPGDGFRLPVQVNVLRNEQGSYRVQSNSPATIRIAGQDLSKS